MDGRTKKAALLRQGSAEANCSSTFRQNVGLQSPDSFDSPELIFCTDNEACQPLFLAVWPHALAATLAAFVGPFPLMAADDSCFSSRIDYMTASSRRKSAVCANHCALAGKRATILAA